MELKELKKGDILKTREYIVMLDYAEEGDNGAIRLHCDWGHCTADGSKDCFFEDYIDCLPGEIVKLYSLCKEKTK